MHHCVHHCGSVWLDMVVYCYYVVCRWYAIDHATRQHGVKKRAGTCHMLPKQRGELSCADPGGVMRVAHRGRMRSIRRTECVFVVAACCQEPQTEPVRHAQASVAFGASYAHLRRMKCVPMPRGEASEVAYGRISEVSIFWTGVTGGLRPSANEATPCMQAMLS